MIAKSVSGFGAFGARGCSFHISIVLVVALPKPERCVCTFELNWHVCLLLLPGDDRTKIQSWQIADPNGRVVCSTLEFSEPIPYQQTQSVLSLAK